MLVSSQIVLDTVKNINLHCLALHCLHTGCMKYGSVLKCFWNPKFFLSLLGNSLWQRLFCSLSERPEHVVHTGVLIQYFGTDTQYCVSGSTIKLCNELSSVAQGWVTVKVTEQVVSTSRTFGNSALPIIHALGWGITPHTEQLWTLYTQLQFTLIGDSQRSLDGGISQDISDRYSLSLRGRQKIYCSKCLLLCKRHQVSEPLQDPVHCRILNFCRERV